ncbi:helix-turn-helix domain-containing protein [Halolamina sp. CBA1230]|uniref:winged helix-turn-helix transcriptional regulator n=1 Tax=Halolamina sp. CBA1230 TaxID=1853690 RepID=UPI0009A21A0A|nr:helix-turn-helix domain-containing protein [Halolamina sp. CBA1230]QKY21527.1 helix-turn-helix domain-containing protein [Halolamina sp. CBA1230]
MSEVRDRLLEHVRDHPGRHASALGRELDLATGQLQYHLRRLRREDRVVADDRYGRTHYFPPGYDERDRERIALARRETARAILAALLSGETPAADLADRLGIARSTLSYHVDRLSEAGLVDERRDECGRVHLSPSDPGTTESLLATVDPDASDRLVDRFTRLVDELLDG